VFKKLFSVILSELSFSVFKKTLSNRFKSVQLRLCLRFVSEKTLKSPA